MSDVLTPFAVESTGPSGGDSAPAWSPTAAIAYGWRTVWSRFEVVGVAFLAVLVAGALAVPAVIAQAAGSTAAYVAIEVVSWFVNAYFGMTLTRYFIKVARGDATGVSELFAGGPYWTYVLSNLVKGLAI